MSEMIERVAAAIKGNTTFCEMSENAGASKIVFERVAVSIARTAIEAMREPTKEMSEAGCPSPDDGGAPYCYDRHVTDRAWRDMIDAALK